MTWRDEACLKILLLVSRWLCTDRDIKDQIKAVANHISVAIDDERRKS